MNTVSKNLRIILSKKLSLIVLSLIYLTGCTHTISRTGYTLDSSNSKQTCDITFVKNAPVDSTKEIVLGTIKLGDSGFSAACGEDDAIAILKAEACNVGADIVNIIEEKRPDLISSCYRATAFLIKTTSDKNNGQPMGIYKHDTNPNVVEKRVATDHTRNTIILIVCIAVGSALGIALGSIY